MVNYVRYVRLCLRCVNMYVVACMHVCIFIYYLFNYI